MNQKDRKRLDEIEKEILSISERMRELQDEKQAILGSDNCISHLSYSVKNTLKRIGIVKDNQLRDFLEGNFENPDTTLFNAEEYKKKKTWEGRLVTLKGLGTVLAKETVRILKEMNF